MVRNRGRGVGIGGSCHRSSRESRHGVRHGRLLGKTAFARTFFRNRWAIADDVAHLLLTIPYESLGARVASDATAFADEVLILGLVKDVEDVGDAGGAALQSFTAEALMARADDAVDAAVSTRSRDGLLGFDHHRRGIVSRAAVHSHVDANGESCQQEHV